MPAAATAKLSAKNSAIVAVIFDLLSRASNAGLIDADTYAAILRHAGFIDSVENQSAMIDRVLQKDQLKITLENIKNYKKAVMTDADDSRDIVSRIIDAADIPHADPATTKPKKSRAKKLPVEQIEAADLPPAPPAAEKPAKKTAAPRAKKTNATDATDATNAEDVPEPTKKAAKAKAKKTIDPVQHDQEPPIQDDVITTKPKKTKKTTAVKKVNDDDDIDPNVTIRQRVRSNTPVLPEDDQDVIQELEVGEELDEELFDTYQTVEIDGVEYLLDKQNRLFMERDMKNPVGTFDPQNSEHALFNV
jgi:hypothetical protein